MSFCKKLINLLIPNCGFVLLIVLTDKINDSSEALINKGMKFDANVGGVKTNKLGSTVKVQGEGTEADNISNYTNRSPYPTLHLIREDSIAKAAEAFPDASAIFDRTIALLEKMGHEGWDKLDIPRCPFPHHKPSENK